MSATLPHPATIRTPAEIRLSNRTVETELTGLGEQLLEPTEIVVATLTSSPKSHIAFKFAKESRR